MTARSALMFVLSGVLAIAGVLMLALAVGVWADVGTPGENATYGIAYFALVIAAPCLVGAFALWRTALHDQQRKAQEAIEARVLRLVMDRDCRVTALEVAMHTDLSLNEAQHYLGTLARSGTVATQVGQNGMLVYCFSDTLMSFRAE